MGYSLDHAPDLNALKCPWCPTTVIEAPLGSAMVVFELHLDEHLAAGTPLPLGLGHHPEPGSVGLSDAA